MLFDSITEGVPTLLTAFSEEMNIYEREYSFTSCKLSLIDNFNKINNDNFYKKIIDEQVKWSKELYQPFDEKYFIDLIK